MFVTWVYPIGYVQNSSRIADIWAHCGYFAVWACIVNPKSIISSYEPDKDNQDIYTSNIEINKLEDRAKLYPYGLGKKDEIIRFFQYKNSALNSIILHPNISIIGELQVHIKEAMKELSIINPDLLKVDVEGVEDEIVYAYLNAWWKPNFICAEFSTNKERSDINGAKKFTEYPGYNHLRQGIIVNSVLITNPL